jgi:quercetin dioxygenase-like cupin family protein
LVTWRRLNGNIACPPVGLSTPSFHMNISSNPSTLKSGEILDLPWGRITWLVSQSLHNSATMTVGRVVIKAGHGNPVHRHPNCDEVLHVLHGRIEHSLGAARFVMNAGDAISIPAGEWHNAQALDGTEAEMVICFSSANRTTETAGTETAGTEA